jgi:hypothetical protein
MFLYENSLSDWSLVFSFWYHILHNFTQDFAINRHPSRPSSLYVALLKILFLLHFG